MADPTQPSRSSSGVRKLVFVVGTLFVVWIVFGQAVPRLMFPLPSKSTTTTAPTASKPEETPVTKDDRIAALQSRVDTLEAKIKALEDVIAASPKPADTAAKEPSPADTERAVRLEARLEQQGNDLQAMKAQLGALATTSTHQLAAVNAFGLMKDAIRRGAPFAAYHAQLTKALESNAEAAAPLKALAPYADQGAITLDELQSSFEVFIPSALGHNGGGLLHSIISIRKVGPQPGQDDEAVIARAETHLNASDVDAALKELTGLSPAATTAFAPWVAHAQAFVATNKAIDALQLALAETKPVPPPTPVPAPIPTPAPAPAAPVVQTPPAAPPQAPVAVPPPAPAAAP